MSRTNEREGNSVANDPELAVSRASDLILEIHRAAADVSLDTFQEYVLNALSRFVLFDSAWWGMVSNMKIHTALAWCLPTDYREKWELHKDSDPIARAAIASPRRAVTFNQDRLAETPGFNAFLKDHGIANVVCMVEPREVLNISFFLSLYRTRAAFSPQEASFVQAMVPHLNLALSTNRLIQFDRLSQSLGIARQCLAIIDEKGLIHNADSGVSELLRQELRGWQGPFVPTTILDRLHSSGEYSSRTLTIRATPIGGLSVLHLCPATPLDGLTKRERDVAVLYAQGATNKSIARDLSISPTTVRHYIRNIYSKFHVTDKAMLARILALSES